MILLKKQNKNVAVFMVITILLLCGGSATIHYCFDGDEPATSMNFGIFIDDTDSQVADKEYVDSNKLLLSENGFKRSFDFTPLLFVVILLMFVFRILRVAPFYGVFNPVSWFQPFVLLPPLRAPPVHS